MSRVDVHPEELLDAAREGELSPADRARLDAHLAHCTACRVELDAMEDFTRELAPRTDDAARAASIVQRALAEAGLPDAGRASRTSHAPGRAAPTSRRRTVAIASAALAVGLFGGAAAAFWAATAGPWSGDDAVEGIEGAGVEGGAGAAGADRAADELDDRAADDDPSARRDDVANDEAGSGADTSGHGDELSSGADTGGHGDEVSSGEATDGSGDEAARGGSASREDRARRPSRPAIAQPTAEELLARGNEARRARRYEEAERTYRTLQRTYPSSREAAVSRVTLGRLLLSSRSDATGALDQFDRYLRAQPAGVLAEEARVGRALALEQLGRAADARTAWRDLLAHHPDSLHADRARRAIE